jgi:glycine/D-amino acid oxidase-like deaminating enzyme/nitrite reductase/ring-hydroxylating ferredoxin subunit
MNSVAQHTRSVWMRELPAAAAPLTGNARAEVAIVGAGIAGLTTAYLLARAGRDVLVIDSGPPGGGMTSRTTAHIATELDDRWADLIALRGLADARTVASAYVGAIDLIESICAAEDIACDFARVDGVLVAAQEGDRETLRRELDASHAVGLADVSWADTSPFPGQAVGPALRYPRQARFHPLRYLRGLLACIARDGGRIVRGHVVDVRGGNVVNIRTATGGTIQAQRAAVCTNTPINDRVTIHTKQAPYRTYVIAASVPRGSVPDCLAWDTLDPYHYTRLQPGADGTDLVIIGGEDHKTGQADDMDERFLRLEAWARARFPEMGRVAYRWSGQVMETIDDIAYLGRNPGKETNVFIATGDSGMGISHGTIGGKIIADAMLGQENPWARVFDPARRTIKAAARFARENLNAVGQMTDHLTPGDVAGEDQVPVGGGAIVRQGLHKVATFRDEDGTVHRMSAVCPHMGCVVAWNPLEKCWDCPCHGSQFSAVGEVINGPASTGLKAIDPDIDPETASAPAADRGAGAGRPVA